MNSSHPPQRAITIFMPVYNGSQFLQETINSIIEQSFSNFELLCVDDTSTDDSYQILQTLASQDARIRVLQKPNGGTVSKSFNYALPNMLGEYVFYTSQDDLMSKDLLEKMYIRAKETNADGTIPHMISYLGDEKNSRNIFVQKDKVISGREAASLSIDWSIHGFVLWKKSLLEKVKFFEFGLYSDEYTTRVLFLESRTIAFCDGIFYYRQNNPNAITKKLSLSWFDKLETNERLRTLFREHSATLEEKKKLITISFNEIFHFQSQYLEKNKKLSKNHRSLAKEKIKLAYKNFEDIKEVSSNLHRFFCTKGYHVFKIYVWVYGKLKKLILNNLNKKKT